MMNTVILIAGVIFMHVAGSFGAIATIINLRAAVTGRLPRVGGLALGMLCVNAYVLFMYIMWKYASIGVIEIMAPWALDTMRGW